MILSILLIFGGIAPAKSLGCRTVNGQLICLLDVKRSAKNYWEYRATVSINGIKQPMVIYNCRDRSKITFDGQVVPFVTEPMGELICSLLKY